MKNIFHQLNKNRIQHFKIESLITLREVAATLEWIVDLPSVSRAEAEFLHKSKQYATQHTAIQKVRKPSINVTLSFACCYSADGGSTFFKCFHVFWCLTSYKCCGNVKLMGREKVKTYTTKVHAWVHFSVSKCSK